MTKNDDILEHIIDIKSDTAGIRQHLKDLNSKVATNVQKINCNQNEINTMKLTVAKWGGGIGAILIILQVALKFIF
jgi:cell division protein ZapA (FtsZ GTPase activity inhibitor)